MATTKSLSHQHYYYPITPPVIFSKFLSKSSDSLIDLKSKNIFQKKQNSKIKKSRAIFSGFETKSIQSTFNSTSVLHRRFRFFRLKHSPQSNEISHVQTLEQIIDQLRSDLQIKTNELEAMKERTNTIQPSNQSIEQAIQLQTMLNARLEEMFAENDSLKKSIEELESLLQPKKPPNSPAANSVLTTAFPDSFIKSTNFTGSVPPSRSEIRHKSEIEIEVKQQQQQLKKPISPASVSSYPPILRPTGAPNKRISTIYFDENSSSSQYPTPKRRFLTNSIQTQTPPLLSNQYEQQLKSLTDETLSKNENIQVLLHELTNCQAIIKQQEQQLMNGKKDRDQLCFIVDERENELRNLKQKNEQLEQMIRNEQEHSNDEKKLLSLLQESQEERDDLLNQQQQTYERIQNLEERIKHYENDVTKMHDQVLCSKIKLDKKTDENQCLINDLTNMKKFCECLEQDKQKYKVQIEYERNQLDECTKLKTFVDIELQNSLEKIRLQRYEYDTLDEALKYSQKQYQILQQNQRMIEDKHEKEIQEFKQHIYQLENQIEEVMKDKTLVAIRCGDLIEENRKLEKILNDKEDDYEEKINSYKEKNSLLSIQIEDVGKQLIETKKQLEFIIIEKDETLADMLVAVRVASEMRYDAEDRLSKANDDLKRVTNHIEQERAVNKEVQRRQMQLPSSNGYCDFGHVRIKEMIRTLEANSRNTSINNTLNNHIDSTVRQRPLSQPCTRTETNVILANNHHRQFGTTTDDAKILSSTKNDSPLLNHSHRSDLSIRSITTEQYDEMKSIVEGVFTRMPGSVCKRDALLKWCVERLSNYGISITNFSNSWIDGIAFCSLLHSYLPDRIDLEMIKNESKKTRFEIAFNIASSVGIVSILDIDEMCSSEWPDWERVMYYVALIFRHFEGSTDNSTLSPILPVPQATSSPISPTFSSSSSSSLCASLRSPNTIPTIFCSPLQTV